MCVCSVYVYIYRYTVKYTHAKGDARYKDKGKRS